MTYLKISVVVANKLFFRRRQHRLAESFPGLLKRLQIKGKAGTNPQLLIRQDCFLYCPVSAEGS